MSQTIDDISTQARIAEPDEAISLEELALASRNHAMPLEALRYDVTPPGLHYVLVHYDIPYVDADAWQLDIHGCVENPVTIDLETLQEMPRHSERVTLECAGNGRALLNPRPVSQPWLTGAVGTAVWTGVRLADLLADAGVTGDGVDVVFSGADHGVERGVEDDYRRGLSLAEATAPEVLVAYEMNGQPLPPQHGFPVRLVVPGWYGMAHVKWLRDIEVIDHRFDGYQNTVSYVLRQDPEEEGVPVTRIEPRALLVPPGDPDFMSRTRVLRRGSHALEGRAWSGWGPVTRVEVSADDGTTWWSADLEDAKDAYAWRRFTTTWDAVPGEHVLRARAHDETGRVQPLEPGWNRGGFAVNSDAPVKVVVLDA
ncbi:MAG TPA: sulfite oxidase [Nocardioidaceae bacterium]|nr:sulfite oxidase [Nocardioidaceae bacterium]